MVTERYKEKKLRENYYLSYKRGKWEWELCLVYDEIIRKVRLKMRMLG